MSIHLSPINMSLINMLVHRNPITSSRPILTVEAMHSLWCSVTGLWRRSSLADSRTRLYHNEHGYVKPVITGYHVVTSVNDRRPRPYTHTVLVGLPPPPTHTHSSSGSPPHTHTHIVFVPVHLSLPVAIVSPPHTHTHLRSTTERCR